MIRLIVLVCISTLRSISSSNQKTRMKPLAGFAGHISSLLLFTSLVFGQTTVTDIDGNTYQTITIGDQVWMAENLKVTHYQNGDPITKVLNASTWTGFSDGAYCNYANDDNNANTYGSLYNWYAVNDTRNIAPAGWHVPTDAELNELEMFIGMSLSEAEGTGFRGTDEGTKLKAISGWGSNGNGTDEFGFTALPAGLRRTTTGNYEMLTSEVFIWSDSEFNDNLSWYHSIPHDHTDINRSPDSKNYGFSVRCVMGESGRSSIHVPTEYATIQAGVDAASAEDTIVIASGTYYENIIVNKPLVFVSESGPQTTIIDGNGLIGIEISVGNSGSISGVAFTNCSVGLQVMDCFNYAVHGCQFVDNVYGVNSHRYNNLQISNSLFIGNDYGYLEGYYGTDAVVVNCTFDNVVKDIVFQPLYGTTAELTISNSVLMGQIDGSSTNPVNLYYCNYIDVNLGLNVTAIDGNISDDPLFVDLSIDDYSLQSSSPCIDAGDPVSFSNDIDGSRNDIGYSGGSGLILGRGIIDFGYVGNSANVEEFVSLSNFSENIVVVNSYSTDNPQFSIETNLPITVNPGQKEDINFSLTPSTTGAESSTITFDVEGLYGTSVALIQCTGYVIDNSRHLIKVPEDAPTIQSAVDVAMNGDTILVAAGTYYENVLVNKQLAFVSVSGPENTIIDGDGSHGIDILAGNPGSTEGFTFTNCNIGLTLANCINYSVNDCWYINNYEGLYSHQNTILQVSYCLFQGNEYGFRDGYYGQSSEIVNCTFDNTINDILFHPAYNTPAELNVHNSIFMGQIDGYDTNPVNLYYCTFVDGNLGINVNNVVGNITGDPLVTDPGTGDYSLQDGSPCIDSGDPLSPRDDDGSYADMGAFPSTLGIPLAVRISVPNEYLTIQGAIDVSRSGDTVLVQPGTYVENLSIEGKEITLGSLFLTTQDTSYISQTIIDGNESGSVIQIFNSGSSYVSLIGVTIQNGSGTNDEVFVPWVGGGGIFTKDANIVIDNCRITNCSESYRYGGGVLFYPSSKTLSLTNSRIDNCSTSDAGGGVALFSGDFVIENTIISNSSAGYAGGAAYVGGDLTIRNSALFFNHASSVGGAFTSDGGELFFDQCEIYGNYSGNGGGAFNIGHSANVNINQCSIVDNDGSTRGGAIIKSHNGTLNIVNSILQNNDDQYFSQLWLDESVSLDVISVEYSNIQQDTIAVYHDGGEDYYLSSTNIESPSDFVSILDQNYRLLATSPLINTGHPDSTDSDGSRADMGAHPYLNSHAGPDWYVAEEGNDIIGTGEDANPFASIQAGINFANDHDSVLIGPGIYTENINFRGHSVSIKGTEGAGNTIVDGNGTGSVFSITSQEDTTTSLEGLTVQNGTGTFVYINEGNQGTYGGGIFLKDSYLKVLSCVIQNNEATYSGGGIGAYEALGISIDDCEVLNNTATQDGGGIALQQGENFVSGTIITGNSAHNGGGMLVNASDAGLTNLRIHDNTATSQGGGIYASYFANYTLSNSIIYSNTSAYGGGILNHYHLTPTLINNTIVNNQASESGGGVQYSGLIDGPQTVINSIVYYNESPNGPQFHSDESGMVLLNSNVQGWDSEDSNINMEPRFVNLFEADFQLSDFSPLLGGGLDTVIVPAFDIAGNFRPNPAGSNPDIGAYESPLAAPVIIIEIQNLSISVNEEILHLTSHNPEITYSYYNSLEEPLGFHQIQVSSLSDFSLIDKWDTYTVINPDTLVMYAGNALTDGETYHIRAKAGSGDIWTDWEALSFRMNSLPEAPGLVSPIANTVIGEDLLLTVENSNDSEEDELLYQFFLFEDVAMSALVDSSELVVEGVDHTMWLSEVELLDNNQYWWTSRVFDGYEYSSLSAPASFLVNTENAAPETFELLFPTPEIVISSLTPTFSWHSSLDVDPEDIVSYSLHLDTPEPGVLIFELGSDTLFFPLEPLLDNTVYYWRVVAKDLLGFETESIGGYRSFVVNVSNDNPSVVDLITPDSVMVLSLTPEMFWTRATDVDPGDMVSYEMHWWGDGIEYDSVLTDTNAVTIPRALQDNMQYFWEVITMDQTDGISHSEPAIFWTDLVPEAPEGFALLSPENDAAGLPDMPSFQWEIAEDPDPMDYATYTLQIASDSSFSDVVVETNTNVEAGLELSESLSADTEYWWRVLAVDTDSLTTESETFMFTVGYVSIAADIALPTEFMLDQNYPNPFNPSTTIRYGLPEEANVSLVIYDVRGQVVQTLKSAHQPAGWYDIVWNGQTADGKTISTGIYFARLVAGEYSQVLKMLYLK